MSPSVSYFGDNLHSAAGIHSNPKPITPTLPMLTDHEAVVDNILQIIANYLLTSGVDDQFISTGRAVLRSHIKRHVEQNEPLELVLPAFPFKSPSSKKVLGTLPDLAEEIFLRRLEDLCVSVQNLYSPGAKLKIVSDGIVYSELLDVSDSTVHRYNAELCSMIKDFGLSHISFVRVQELLSSNKETAAGDTSDMTEEDYLLEAPQFREALSSIDIGNWSVEDQIKGDEGNLRTYSGYMRFLEFDCEERQNISVKNSGAGKEGGVSFRELSRKAQKRFIHGLAQQMMINGAHFSALVTKSFPTAIRLSIHRHPNTGPKFALRIYADIELPRTPWHNVAIMKRDDTIDIQHAMTVDPSTHELVHRRGHPYYWREIDPAMQWGDRMGVLFDRLLPNGLQIRPVPPGVISWNDVPTEKLRDLASRYSLVVVRGCGSVDDDDDDEEYRLKAGEMGTIMPSVSVDILQAVKEDPNVDISNVITDEAMPYRFDVVLKTKTKTQEDSSGANITDSPQFQVFRIPHAPASADDPPANTGTSADADAVGRALLASSSITPPTHNLIPKNNLNVSPRPVADDMKKCQCQCKRNSVFTPNITTTTTTTDSSRKEAVVRRREEWLWNITITSLLAISLSGIPTFLTGLVTSFWGVEE